MFYMFHDLEIIIKNRKNQEECMMQQRVIAPPTYTETPQNQRQYASPSGLCSLVFQAFAAQIKKCHSTPPHRNRLEP